MVVTSIELVTNQEETEDEQAPEVHEGNREEGDQAGAEGEDDSQEEGAGEEEGQGDNEEGLTLHELNRIVQVADEAASHIPRGSEEWAQLPLNRWTEHQLAEAGIDLAEHMHKLKVYEDSEAKHKRHYKGNRDRMVDVIEGLRLRIREQRHARGIAEDLTAGDEEE